MTPHASLRSFHTHAGPTARASPGSRVCRPTETGSAPEQAGGCAPGVPQRDPRQQQVPGHGEPNSGCLVGSAGQPACAAGHPSRAGQWGGQHQPCNLRPSFEGHICGRAARQQAVHRAIEQPAGSEPPQNPAQTPSCPGTWVQIRPPVRVSSRWQPCRSLSGGFQAAMRGLCAPQPQIISVHTLAPAWPCRSWYSVSRPGRPLRRPFCLDSQGEESLRARPRGR